MQTRKDIIGWGTCRKTAPAKQEWALEKDTHAGKNGSPAAALAAGAKMAQCR